MAAPSNIRINPFTGTGGATNYINLTEVHIIPAASPFVIRLNEVPQKKDPSNMKAFYMDETTGAVTTTALTEVAATPGAGQFRPDYSTNADNDEDWNTGLIEFSSADAGKSVQISYTGMGTLAGVKDNRFPAWWLDRGDGSDGDFIPTANVTISGLKQYKRVFIKRGITVMVGKYARICCQGAFINNGTITANGQGGAGGSGGYSGRFSGTDGGDGSYGGAATAGGAGTYSGTPGRPGHAGPALNYTEEIILAVMRMDVVGFGAGGGGEVRNSNNPSQAGGTGSAGGGCIKIICGDFKNTGSITANASGGSHAGGGGGGGSVQIVANNIFSKGTLSATGTRGGGTGWTGTISLGGNM